MSPSSRPAPHMLGPYELLQRIATGGMAEVYLARRAGPFGFQKFVAVKRILPQLTSDPDFVSMFIDEARVCARLGHPNIVQVFDFGEHDGELYMAMEYVDGTTGARLVRAAASRADEIPLDVSLHIGLSILRGLGYAHAARDDEGAPLGLVHRDVSPGNVLIDRSGAVKLTDFGIARAAEFDRRTEAGQLKGKLGYMSPEQVTGRELDARSDLFTAAIVLAELVTLRPLFSGGSEIDVLMRIRDADLSQLDRSASRVPDDIRGVLFKALARDRTQRYGSAQELAEALEDIVRRRRLQVGPAKLAAWLDRLRLVGGEPPPDDEEVESPTRELSVPSQSASALARSSVAPPTVAPGAAPPAGSTAGEVAPSIYRVRTKDGAVLGPLAYPRLVELFVTGRINADSELSRESGPFKDARAFPELSRFVSSSALSWEPEMPKTAVDRGAIARLTLPARIFALAAARDTGALHLVDGARRKKVYVVEGVPEFVASTDKGELLGEQLVKRGQVLRMEVDMALAMLPRFGGRIGDALVGLGVLRPIELFRAIAEQTQERFLEIFDWRSGEIGFVRGARSHEETFPLGLDTSQLVARAVRERYAPGEPSTLLAPLEDAILSPVVPLPVRIEAYRLGSREEQVLRAVDGRRTLGALAADLGGAGLDRSDVDRAVFLGLSCEIIQSPRWTELLGRPA